MMVPNCFLPSTFEGKAHEQETRKPDWFILKKEGSGKYRIILEQAIPLASCLHWWLRLVPALSPCTPVSQSLHFVLVCLSEVAPWRARAHCTCLFFLLGDLLTAQPGDDMARRLMSCTRLEGFAALLVLLKPSDSLLSSKQVAWHPHAAHLQHPEMECLDQLRVLFASLRNIRVLKIHNKMTQNEELPGHPNIS